MANTVIALKKSATPSATPSSLANGELAINYADGKLFYKAANGAIVQFSQGGPSYGTVNANGTLLVAGTSGDVLTIVPGNNITITADAINDKLTISSTGGGGASVTVSNVAPVSPSSGDLWWNDVFGELYIYYVDADSSQWVVATGASGGAYTFSSVIYDAANSAFNKANTACTKADLVQQNTSFSYSTANTAYLVANAAFAKANSVGNSALANTSTLLNGNLTIIGNVTPFSSNTYDLGTSSYRWRNIYTGDLNLSNGIGDYTIIEGEDDLFLVNNRSGKHYKFALIEVDPKIVPPKAGS